MKKLFLILLVFALQPIKAQHAEINWIGFEDLEDSLKVKTKPVVLYFYTDWCVYCKKMDKNAFRDPEIVSKVNQDFYAVKMNAESTEPVEFEGQTFTNEQAKVKRNGVHQIPQILATREDRPISFPVVMVLDENFRVKRRSFEYLTSEKLKILIKD
ncbi:thioredoxin fold domain-containing protein [Gramella sp. AN32]|uniref:Thioredoxin family protein n=1 Tax=Christiangramia antarctica TaxID=2058158 RepID=A0ABW5WYR2_9FLAO|nr:thioredoxin fold domain-containing protein [Gramella sp. AN32]MCM4155096.1 thioredoxin family protein [Gramella sp. AN32]